MPTRSSEHGGHTSAPALNSSSLTRVFVQRKVPVVCSIPFTFFSVSTFATFSIPFQQVVALLPYTGRLAGTSDETELTQRKYGAIYRDLDPLHPYIDTWPKNHTMAAGTTDVPNGGTLSKIQEALEAIHNPYSSNDARRQAQDFLEQIKDNAEAPMQGFNLASDKSQPPVVRHYALSLLEHAIRYRWSLYNDEQTTAVRDWVVQLGQSISAGDPAYIRNKTAQLWVDVAKRCWGGEWLDMDSMLVQLWEVPDSAVHKELVMFILETLSDEVFVGDDSVVALREGVLSKACVEVFTSTAVLVEAFPNRQAGPNVRHGHDGWLLRISRFLELCLAANPEDNTEVKTCVIKGFSVFLSLMPWAIPKAVANASCVRVMCAGLASPVSEIQKSALDALHALYCRVNFTDDEFLDLVAPMYSAESIRLCSELLNYAAVDPSDIDEEKYQVLKKLSEMLSSLGDYFERKYSRLPETTAKAEFLQLLVRVVQSQSLMVSIPVLLSWTKILNHREVGKADIISSVIGPLLEVCSSRMVRYEHLPEENEDPTFLFLQEDTDTVPERHAFLGNYRRYSAQIIEAIVQLRLVEAVSHVLGQTETMLQHLYDQAPPFAKQSYTKYSMPSLQVDSHFTVIEATLKGYAKWKKHGADGNKAAELDTNLEQWCQKLLTMTFEDPMIRKRVLQLAVYFSTTALKREAGFMLKVLEHILMTWPSQEPEYRAFNDAIKDLQSESMVEMQRLASEMPDHLLGVFDQIESRVNEMLASGDLDEKRSLAYRSFLFLIIHRATTIDTNTKVNKLQGFINPVKAQWKTNETRTLIRSYSGFCEQLALDKAQIYLVKHDANSINDWGTHELDAEGLALQSELEERLKSLPLRATKSFLAFSVERLDRTSAAFQASHILWQEGFSNILGDLLQLLSFAHAAYNPENWSQVPEGMRPMIGRVLADRFWQAGISDGSKDDFYARVVDKKNTMEGLASSVRGSVRFVRETSYAIIYCMSRLDVQFYGFDGLSQPLANALFTNSTWLSTHQQTNLLNLVRYLVDDCPVDYRAQFLPQLLAACFSKMDVKINGEWEQMAAQQTVTAAGEAGLKEEMKAESVLRQVTYTSVVMVADFLDPTKANPSTLQSRRNGGSSSLPSDTQDSKDFPSLRKFCLSQQEIVEPLLIFCTHGIRMKDTRCSGMMLRLFISLVPEFSQAAEKKAESAAQLGGVQPQAAAAIREYISNDVLKACLTSFHEPYFVEVQKELAALIAAILVHYTPSTDTPKNVLMSLPNINASEMERLAPYIEKPGSHLRQQRAIVLELLKDLKGVSVSEMGKLNANASNSASNKRSARSKMAQGFMSAPSGKDSGLTRMEDATGHREKTPDGLDGVASLFDT